MTAIVCLTIIVVALLVTDGDAAVAAAVVITNAIVGLVAYRKGRAKGPSGPSPGP